MLPIPKFPSHSLKLIIILLLSGDISLNPGPAAQNIKISTINVRSIKCKTAPFTEFVTSEKLEVVAVTETWLADIAPPGYHFHHQPRSNKKVGGGVGVLVSDKFKTKVQKIPSYNTFEALSAEISIFGPFYLSLQTPRKYANIF